MAGSTEVGDRNNCVVPVAIFGLCIPAGYSCDDALMPTCPAFYYVLTHGLFSLHAWVILCCLLGCLSKFVVSVSDDVEFETRGFASLWSASWLFPSDKQQEDSTGCSCKKVKRSA